MEISFIRAILKGRRDEKLKENREVAMDIFFMLEVDRFDLGVR